VLFIKSKIQFFESKSQLPGLVLTHLISCLSSQRYNFLKANHNERWLKEATDRVVYQVKDTIFWKQITTVSNYTKRSYKLFIKSKIQFFESKSQPASTPGVVIRRCLSSQRYNFLKANHNSIGAVWSIVMLFIKSKIQFFESKSQLLYCLTHRSSCCLSSQRYNFLKANHNWISECSQCIRVVYQVKDTIFWKQITTLQRQDNFLNRCLSSQRYNFLKANHNRILSYSFLFMLFIKSKIQFFESKSQRNSAHSAVA